MDEHISIQLTNFKIQTDRNRYLIIVINININITLINNKYYCIIVVSML